MRPPITMVANGGHISFSRPVVMARGQSPAIVVAEVINMGLVRSRTAAKAAAPRLQPCRMSCCIRSTSRMAGLTLRPVRTTAPSAAMMLNDMPAKARAHTAPRRVSGTAINTRIGRVRDSKVIARTRNSNPAAGTPTLRSQVVVSSVSSVLMVVPWGLGMLLIDSAI